MQEALPRSTKQEDDLGNAEDGLKRQRKSQAKPMWVEKAPAHPLFSVNAHYDLKWFSPPNIIKTLVPAVTAALKNTAPAFSAR